MNVIATTFCTVSWWYCVPQKGKAEKHWLLGSRGRHPQDLYCLSSPRFWNSWEDCVPLCGCGTDVVFSWLWSRTGTSEGTGVREREREMGRGSDCVHVTSQIPPTTLYWWIRTICECAHVCHSWWWLLLMKTVGAGGILGGVEGCMRKEYVCVCVSTLRTLFLPMV